MMTDEALAKALQQYGKVIRAEIDDLVARSFAVHTADQGELSREVFRAALPKIREGFQSIQPTEQEGFLLRCIRAAAAECEDRSPTSAASQRNGHFAFRRTPSTRRADKGRKRDRRTKWLKTFEECFELDRYLRSIRETPGAVVSWSELEAQWSNTERPDG